MTNQPTDLIEQAAGMADTGQQPTATAVRPDGLPNKFWDRAAGCVRTDQLWRSYAQLERRFGAGRGVVPESPDHYSLELGSATSDPAVNARLHAAGFSNEQVQLVYELARDYVAPAVTALHDRLQAEHLESRLEHHFGGKENWRHVSRQLDAWSRANLPEGARGALASTPDGVLAMHRMMTSSEPGLEGRGEGATGELNETQLREMMKDPRYWRDQDPALVARIRAGFEKLYPG